MFELSIMWKTRKRFLGIEMKNVELEKDALMALSKAFAKDLAGMTAKYLKAAEGFDKDYFRFLISVETNLFKIEEADDSEGDFFLNIHAKTWNGDFYSYRGYDCLENALSDPEACEIYLQGKLLFVEGEEEWELVKDAADKK